MNLRLASEYMETYSLSIHPQKRHSIWRMYLLVVVWLKFQTSTLESVRILSYQVVERTWEMGGKQSVAEPKGTKTG